MVLRVLGAFWVLLGLMMGTWVLGFWGEWFWDFGFGFGFLCSFRWFRDFECETVRLGCGLSCVLFVGFGLFSLFRG